MESARPCKKRSREKNNLIDWLTAALFIACSLRVRSLRDWARGLYSWRTQWLRCIETSAWIQQSTHHTLVACIGWEQSLWFAIEGSVRFLQNDGYVQSLSNLRVSLHQLLRTQSTSCKMPFNVWVHAHVILRTLLMTLMSIMMHRWWAPRSQYPPTHHRANRCRSSVTRKNTRSRGFIKEVAIVNPNYHDGNERFRRLFYKIKPR